MSSSISRFKQQVKKFLTRTGVEITVSTQPMTEKERMLAMILGFAYSVLGFGFGVYALYKGVELFQAGIIDGHGTWHGGGFEFENLAPGTLLFIIGAFCFKTSAFIVKSGDSEAVDQKDKELEQKKETS